MNFIIDEILREPALFLGIIAFVGLLIQKKDVTELMTGTIKTIVGVVILTQGTGMIVSAINPLANAFNELYQIPANEVLTPIGADAFIEEYGTEIGLVMLFAFIINLTVARLTPLKNVFLTGHMLFWFPFVFIAVATEAGMQGVDVVMFATILTSLYIVITPALIRPLVKKVTGTDHFTLGHPTIGLSLIAAYVGKLFGNKKTSTEDLKFPKQVEFLREITITSSLVIFLVYMVMALILSFNGAVEMFNPSQSILTFSILQGVLFGAGLTMMLQGVRMMLAEIIPAFKGISDRVIPNAIPALDSDYVSIRSKCCANWFYCFDDNLDISVSLNWDYWDVSLCHIAINHYLFL